MKFDREMLQVEGNHVKACMEMQKFKVNDELKNKETLYSILTF